MRTGRWSCPGSSTRTCTSSTAASALVGAAARREDAGEFVARIKAFAATVPPGTWITDGDWDHEQWGGELPRASGSIRSRRDIPSGSTGSTGTWPRQQRGARGGGVTRATRDVAGGTIVRDARGEPTGVLKDNAQSLVDARGPRPAPELEDRALDAAMRYVAEQA